MTDWAIGIDFGSARSAAAAADRSGSQISTSGGPGRRVVPLEVAGRRAVSSTVALTAGGELVTGDPADELALVSPERAERSVKDVVGQAAPLLLGGHPVDVRDAVAAVLRPLIDEGRVRAGGSSPVAAVLTHPARWATVRCEALRDAAGRAGLERVELVPEPVAAACHYGEHLAPGAAVAVFDLGAASLDAAVLRRTSDGFELAGVPGGDDGIGGDRFDHLLFVWSADQLRDVDPGTWDDLLGRDDPDARALAAALRGEVRRAKEALSSYTSTQVALPASGVEVLVNRSQFEALVVDDVERAVEVLAQTVSAAGMAPEELAEVHLVGGSARIPLVAQLVAERFGAERLVTRDDPKSVVALGAARLASRRLPLASPTPSPSSPSASASSSPSAGSSSSPLSAPPFVPTASPAPGVSDPRVVSPPPLRSSPPAPVAGTEVSLPSPMTPLPPPTAPVEPAQVVPQVTIAWRASAPAAPGRLAADQRGVVFGDRDGGVRSLDGASGRVQWHVPINAPVWAAPALAGDQVVVAGLDGRVGLLDRATGAGRWWAATGASVGSAPAVAGSMVLVGDDAGAVTGFDRATGAIRWRLPLGAAVRADLVSTGSGVVAATVDGGVYVIDAASGACRWGYRMAGGALTSPAVVIDRVLVPSEAGIVYGLSLASGEAVFGVRTSGRITTSVGSSLSAFAVVDDTSTLRVHRADTGQVIVEIALSGSGGPGGSGLPSGSAAPGVAVAAGEPAGVVLVPHPAPTLAVVETGGALVGVELPSGQVRFAVPTGGGNRTAPVRTGGIVVAATTFGQLYGVVAP
ncbi:MAG: Hsp70 family protein [Acidimicrobiales bacterium]|nr:Hsp70 family protein [Acidimicrobiales bacterium]MCB9392176.1 Hsp70 family protein [Acidimicrobiaceae bacterium]